MKFSKERRRTIADIFGNISSAWFIGGVIGPWLAKAPFSLQLISDVAAAILITVVFAFLLL